MNLLSYDSFKKFESATALSIIDAASRRQGSTSTTPAASNRVITAEELNTLLSPFDMKRLQSYADNMIDYHVIIDLIPTLATLYFSKRLSDECTLSAAQQAILLALGLQRKPVEALETELGLSSTQTLALFAKILKRIVNSLQEVRKLGAGRDIPTEEEARENVVNNSTGTFRPVEETVEEELQGEPSEEARQAKTIQRELLDSMDMSQ